MQAIKNHDFVFVQTLCLGVDPLTHLPLLPTEELVRKQQEWCRVLASNSLKHKTWADRQSFYDKQLQKGGKWQARPDWYRNPLPGGQQPELLPINTADHFKPPPP